MTSKFIMIYYANNLFRQYMNFRTIYCWGSSPYNVTIGNKRLYRGVIKLIKVGMFTLFLTFQKMPTFIDIFTCIFYMFIPTDFIIC